MKRVMDDGLKDQLEAGIEALSSSKPTTDAERDKALAALLELQLRKQQSIQIGRFRATGLVTYLVVVAAVAVVWMSLPYVVDIVRAWRGTAAAQKQIAATNVVERVAGHD